MEMGSRPNTLQSSTPGSKAFCFIDAMDAPSGKSPPVVLIVEDDPLLRLLAVEVFEEAGYVALETGDAFGPEMLMMS
jgi:hypothetical protein